MIKLKTLFSFCLVTVMVSCSPAYAKTGNLDAKGCNVVSKASKESLLLFRDGASSFQAMNNLEHKPSPYWEGSTVAKVFTQVWIVDLRKNVLKGFSNSTIMNAVNEQCRAMIDKEL